MTLTERLLDCQRQFNEAQVYAVLEDFDTVKTYIEKRAQVLAQSSEEIQAEINKWQTQIESASSSIKKHLEAGIRELQKKYEKQSAAEKSIVDALEVNLIWNSNNGDKELILPFEWNPETEEQYSLLKELYKAAETTIAELDTAAETEKWNGYTKIVTRNVTQNEN
ncbi:hypothetical protein JW851_01725, partial [Candidatus Woesearchaeota archaeon]|nr:hypothetical protein [Candidatus Woesearchaeota archaeon]